jgi:hypothetical protein
MRHQAEDLRVRQLKQGRPYQQLAIFQRERRGGEGVDLGGQPVRRDITPFDDRLGVLGGQHPFGDRAAGAVENSPEAVVPPHRRAKRLLEPIRPQRARHAEGEVQVVHSTAGNELLQQPHRGLAPGGRQGVG